MWPGAHRPFPNRRRVACAAALSVCTSFVLQCVSLATKWWVHIQWRFNATFYYRTDLGLWQKCEIVTEFVSNMTVGQNQYCTYDIIFDMVRAPDFMNMHIIAIGAPITALIMTISGGLTILLSNSSKKPSSQLVAAILFIVTGMLSLTGFIIFIDHASEEIGNKKNLAHQKGARSETKFEYGYGISLLMFGTSVIFSEFCGFAYGAFYLHYYRHKYVYRMPQFAAMDRAEATGGALLHYKIKAASRCLNQTAFASVNAKLSSYRAPSRSCNDLTRARDNTHDRNVAYIAQQDADWTLRHQIVKSSSVFTIKANSNANHDAAYTVDSSANSVNPIACPATSATTLYSRVTEV